MDKAKRDEKFKAEILAALAAESRRADFFPMPRRRMLRVLEEEGKIYCDEQYFWHVVR